MRDTSKVRRTVVVDEIQELSKREMEDVTGGHYNPGGRSEVFGYESPYEANICYPWGYGYVA